MSGVAPSRKQRVRAGGECARDLAGDGEDLASFLEREVGRDQGAAPLARLDDDGRGAEPGDDAIARREAPGRRLDAGRVLGDDEPGRRDLTRQLAVRRRIVAVDPAAEHRDRRAGGLERAAVRLGVDATGEPTDDDQPCGGELAPEAASDLAPVRRAGAGPDDRHSRPREQRGLLLAAHEEPRRRVVDRPQQRREAGIGAGEEAETEPREPLELGTRVEGGLERREARAARLADEMGVVRRREGSECQLIHAANSFGERYASASATCSGSTSSEPASAAAVRATRATRARPRPDRGNRSTARLSSSSASFVRLSVAPVSRRRPTATRSRTGAEASEGPAASSSARGPRHGNDEVEAVEQRSRELVAEGGQPLWRA